MWQVLFLSALSLAGMPVEVKPLAGSTVSGELVDLTSQAVTVQTATGRQTLEINGLWELVPTKLEKGATEPTTTWVELTDGSQLHATKFTITKGTAAIGLLSGQAVSIPTRAIRAVRWRDHAQTPELGKQWADMVSQKLESDVLVVRRTSSLDQLEGVVQDVSADSVQFEFNGQRMDVNRKKLDGMLFYHPVAGDAGRRLCQLTEVSKSQWSVKSLRLVDGQIEVLTPAGVKHLLPAAQLAQLNFSSGNMVWLGDLEPEKVQWRPYVGSQLPQPHLVKLFQPRKDQGFGGEPLLLGGVTYPRGLAVRSRTELVYRLTEAFRQFHAIVGIDDRVRESGNVDLVISGDERQLLTKTLTGRDPPLTVDLDITGVKRLKILVDFGQELDIADILNLCEARLNK